MRRRPELRWAVLPAIALAAFALLTLAERRGALELRELQDYDRRLRAAVGAEGDARVSLVTIGEEDFERFGFPIPDRVLARALETLMAAGPTAIGVDLYRDQPVGEGHGALARVAAANQSIVFVEKLPSDVDAGVAAPPFLEDPERVGFADMLPDRDGILRRSAFFLWPEDGSVSVSLALRLALIDLAPDGITTQPDPAHPDWIRLGATTFRPLEAGDGPYAQADSAGYQFLLDYARGHHPFPGHRLGDLIDGAIPARAFGGRVVLVGTTAPSVKDDFYTPLSLGNTEERLTYGVEIHAHAVDQLLRFARAGGTPLRFPAPRAETAWLLFWATLGTVIGAFSPSLWIFTAAALLAGAGLHGLAALAFGAGVWVPTIAPSLGLAGTALLALAYTLQRERAQRHSMMRLLSPYLSREVARQLWQNREQFMEEGRPRPELLEVSAMFTDLRGFTSAAEGMKPGELMDWINQYMAEMARLVEGRRGMVSDILGDGLIAFFGVPIASRSEAEFDADAQNAVWAALDMAAALEKLNQRWAAAGLPTARLRIGIQSGPAIAGCMGNQDRLKYTLIGDTVNTASRLESFDKEGFDRDGDSAPVRILVGGKTWERSRGRFEGEDLGEHRLRGRMGSVSIHRILRPSSPGPEATQ